MVIAHNISALNTFKSLGMAGKLSDKSMEKLSSGYKINRAGDDAAGLSISEKMRSQIRGLNQASTNAENGVSMIQTAEGALNEEHSILQRMRELAVQSATDTNASEDREALQSEFEQLTSEVNRIGNTTEFNGMKVLNGDKQRIVTGGSASTWTILANDLAKATEFVNNFADIDFIAEIVDDDVKITSRHIYATTDEINAEDDLVQDIYSATKNVTGVAPTFSTGRTGDLTDSSVYFHVGANKDQVINAEFHDMRAAALGVSVTAIPAGQSAFYTKTMTVNNGTDTTGVEYALDISTRAGANKAIDIIDNAIKAVSEERSTYGAVQNRLEYTMNNLNTTSENMTAAESTIRDVDMASEMMELTKNNILQQAAQAMLSQGMQRPQQALQLLQG